MAKMSTLTPRLDALVRAEVQRGHSFVEGVKVNFRGRAQGRLTRGFFICAFDAFPVAQSLARNIAVKLGLGQDLAANREGVENVLAEFLNIIIGLTCSDWAKNGLEIDFDPPRRLGTHDLDPAPPGTEAYHLTLKLPDNREIAIFLSFQFPESGQ
jgi:CheY-specific phosphatase CheX